MQFETRRLSIRPWQVNIDARHAMDIYGDARVMAWVEDGGRDTSLRQVQGRLQRYRDMSICGRKGVGSWAVEQKDIGRVVGHVMLRPLPDIKAVKTQPAARLSEDAEERCKTSGMATDYVEIGWHFRPASWGYGYAREAAARVVQYAFKELRLPLLIAVTAPENRRSVALVERLGMEYDGLTARYYGGQSLLLYKLFPAAAIALSQLEALEGQISQAQSSSQHPHSILTASRLDSPGAL